MKAPHSFPTPLHSFWGALALWAFCFTPCLLAQHRLSGTVSDPHEKPLAYASVALLHAVDSTLVHGVLTNDAGAFLFDNVPAGQFLLQVSMLGYAPGWSSAIAVDADHHRVEAPQVVLQEQSAVLGEVSVTAKRPFLEQKIDRTVINVANSITNAGGSALQVLQRAPGVQVNMLTKTIALAGKQGVVVMINNKLTRLPPEAVVDMLAGMSADQIDHIELIHTPPANFEAEGNAGIVHIVLKQSGDTGLSGGYSSKGGYGSGRKYGAGTYFNYRKKSVNVFGNYDLDHNLNPQIFTNYRRVQSGTDVLETSSHSDRPYTPTTTQHARIGADFQVSKRTVVGVLGSFFDRNWYMEAVNKVEYLKNSRADSLLRMPVTEVNHNRSFSGNLNLSHQFSAHQSLNVDADFISYDISNPSSYDLQHLDAAERPTAQSGLRISKKTPIQIGVAKMDYAVGLGKNTRLETGLKGTRMHFENNVAVDQRRDQGLWQPVGLYTSRSEMNERVLGAFASVATKWGPRTEVKAGLRYEHTDTRLDSGAAVIIVDRNYGSWFPTVFISRSLSKEHTLQASYARRITRPNIRRLAPWLIFADPTTLEGGNPALQPSFTDAFNLNYGIKAWRLGVSYSVEHAPMNFVPRVDKTTNRQFNLFENLGALHTWSANLYVPWQPASWWDMNYNLYANHSLLDFQLEGRDLQVRNVAYGVRAAHTLRLPKKYTLEITGDYNGPAYWGIAYWRATGSLNVGIEKNLGPTWGKLRFNANDLFRSTNWYGTTDQPAIGLFVKSSYRFTERVFMLSWNNTFGNRKLKSQRQRATGSEEEWRRI